MSAIEILAPAGGMEQLIAAVRCGADAVYLGAGGFNARRGAENFAGDALARAVAYCHGRGVKVHVTVNTLVMDAELSALEETLRRVAESGADAVIVQDLAVLALLRRHCPDLALHASTQMTVHNLDGARLMAGLGFRRVVLARELTLREIETITARCGIETEVFVHGALCMSMSGGCYLSAMLGGRSGNRGGCAQPCRLDWRCGGHSHVLSLKDMSHIGHLAALRAAGVASLKIEGRMKRPEYVAAAVTACRRARDGEPYDLDSLRAVFSRSGFTDGYLTGKRDAAMFGHRTREDVTAAEGVLAPLRSLYKAERQSVPVDMSLELGEDASLLTVSDGTNTVLCRGETPQTARTRPTDAESARRSLEKTGGTPFLLRNLVFRSDPGRMLPAAGLNALRREALEALLQKREAPSPHPFLAGAAPPRPLHTPPETPALWGRYERAEQLGDLSGLDRVILPVAVLAAQPALVDRLGPRLTGELPALVFPGEEAALRESCAGLRRRGLRELLGGNAYALPLARELGFSLRGGLGLNVTNSVAAGEYADLGLESLTASMELTLAQIGRLESPVPLGLVVYGALPLMRFRACPARGRAGCGGCDGAPTLTDRRGTAFPLLCHDRRYGTLLNSLPLYAADRRLPRLDFWTLYFTRETPAQTEAVIRLVRAREKAPFPRTAGLYVRGVE